MGTIIRVFGFLLLAFGAKAQFVQHVVFWPSNTVVNSLDVIFTNNVMIGNILKLEDTNSPINIGTVGDLQFRADASNFKMLISDNFADLARLSIGFGRFSGADLNAQISWSILDSGVLEFMSQDRSTYVDIRQGAAFIARNIYNTNAYFSPTETNFSTATNLVIDLQNSASYQRVIVTNNFTFGITNFFHGVAMAVKFDPVDNGSNYTITLDSSWERYGTNFGSAEITIQPTKAAILSVTSFSGTAADVAASIRYQR